MEFKRSSGVLLHVSSLPSRGPIGDLGPAAHEFVSFLAAANQHIWQVLPLSPTGYGNSPYAASSAFAGNPFLISLEVLRDWGWISAERVDTLSGAGGAADFNGAEDRKLPLLHEAARNFIDHALDNEKTAAQWGKFQQFCRDEGAWLNDYAFYAVLRREFKTGQWTEWPEPFKRRDPKALDEFGQAHGRALVEEQVLQFAFSEQ
jgi:4-alpha-glucanotransferase